MEGETWREREMEGERDGERKTGMQGERWREREKDRDRERQRKDYLHRGFTIQPQVNNNPQTRDTFYKSVYNVISVDDL